MSRGSKSYQRDRCTLHKKHVDDFVAFLEFSGDWTKRPLTGHSYEVVHVQRRILNGSVIRYANHCFVYRNDHNDHLTVQADLVPYLRQFMQERK